MQLGDWVTFETIVQKQATADGSQPVTRQLRRTRRGMIVGSRAVYDAQRSSPPTLSNRQRVLLVAVSPHRRYRVFPADATLTAAPRRRPAVIKNAISTG
jgi:hypothetical protein